MKYKLAISLSIILAGSAFSSCKKCYECTKPIVYYSMDTDTIFSDAYYYDETCSHKEVDKFRDSGYTCIDKP